MKRSFIWSVAATAGLAVFGCFGSAATAATFVSAELVLSVDVSGSINDDEFRFQRSSYANVFRNQSVINLIESLNNGIAVTMQYWGNRPVDALGWYHITNEQSASIFARDIERTARPFTGLTNIAGAINGGRVALSSNQFESDRKVIDISSDGRQNIKGAISGRAGVDDLCAPERVGFFNPVLINDDLSDSCLSRVRTARDLALDEGITINGLPILTEHSDLGGYFVQNVIGGSNSFVQPASGFSDFQQAIIAKVRREIAIKVDQETAEQPPAPPTTPSTPPPASPPSPSDTDTDATDTPSTPSEPSSNDPNPDLPTPVVPTVLEENPASVPESSTVLALSVVGLVGWSFKGLRKAP